MKFGIAGAAFAVIAGFIGASAQAETAEQTALSQCVVMRTTGADRILAAKWIFAAMAKSPQIAELSAVNDQRRVELDKAFSKLLTRIVMKDCFAEVQPVAAENFEDAFELVGRSLGEVAMQEVMGNENVDKAIAAYTDYLSEDDFKPLMDSLPKRQSK